MFNFYLNKSCILLLLENGRLKPSYVLAKCRSAEQRSRSKIEHYEAILHTGEGLREAEKVVLLSAIESEKRKLDDVWHFANEVQKKYPDYVEVSLASILKRFE